MSSPTLLYHNNTCLLARAFIDCQASDYPTQSQHLKAYQRTNQSTAVRQLLRWCCHHHYPNYTLDDSQHPYRLVAQGKPSLFVSFSHSKTQVALMIADVLCGIDVELRAVKDSIVKRFFHANEQKLIARLPSQDRPTAQKRLWQLKECLVKLEASTLAHTITKDRSALLTTLLSAPDGVPVVSDGYWLWAMGDVVGLQQG